MYGHWGKGNELCTPTWFWSHLLKKPLMENFIFCAVFRISFGALLSNAYLPKSLQIGQNLKMFLVQRIFDQVCYKKKVILTENFGFSLNIAR